MKFFSTTPYRFLLPVAFAAGVTLTSFSALTAQTLLADAPVAPVIAPAGSEVSSSALPDAPSAIAASEGDPLRASILPDAPAPGTAVAPKYAKFIAGNETAQKINAHDKIIIGARDLYSVENFLAIVASAGYEHLTNGEPNYGRNSTAFGKRVGAAAIRETSQGVFTDMVFSPVFHTDPRYFALGSDAGFIHRVFYSATRVLVTRTDSGKETVNAALLAGYAATSAMTPLYYPQVNRNFKDVASGYGGSLGGAAIGFLFSEFSSSILQTLHMEKKP